MESLTADGQPPSFLQTAKPSVVPRRHLRLLRRRSGQTALRSVRAAAALLRKRGEELRSTDLLRLASEASEDPLGKVKQMIQALVERLLKEAQSEATHKGWCDAQISLAEQTRDLSSETIEEVNGRLAVNVARQEKLSQSVQTLSTELQALNQTLEEARDVRAQERIESAAAIEDAKSARNAVQEAIRQLSEFYGTAANAKVSFLQQAAKQVRRSSPVADDLPDAGFDDVYT